MKTSQCLFRHTNESFCSPMHPLYIALHGADSRGGRIAAAGTPVDYRYTLLQDSPVRSDQEKIYKALDQYVESLDKQFDDVRARLLNEGQSENEVRIKSLYLWSKSPGTGKTTTAAAIMNEYLVRNFIGALERKRTPAQRPVYFLDVNSLQTIYNEFNRPRVPDRIAERAADRYYTATQHAVRSEFVVLDDIGVREASEGFRGDLHHVIEHRVSNQMPTVYTSNLPLEDLPHVFNEPRLADRIGDMTQTIHFEGGSKRGRRK